MLPSGSLSKFTCSFQLHSTERLRNENEDMPKTQVYSIYCETDVVN